jgi:hypothetical protein
MQNQCKISNLYQIINLKIKSIDLLKKMINRFVLQEKYLLSKLIFYKSKNIIPIIDYVVENNNDTSFFERKYKDILSQYPNNFHTIKLTNINMCKETTYQLVNEGKYNSCKLLLDTEDRIDHITHDIITDNNDHVFKTYQMYRRDSISKLILDIEKYDNQNKTLNVNLVRGSYSNQYKYQGQVYPTKQCTDEAYNEAIDIVLESQYKIGEVIFASHNQYSFDKIKNLTGKKYYHSSFMGFEEYFANKGEIQKMVYVPFGPFTKTLPYLHRLYTNPIEMRKRRKLPFKYPV